MDDAPARAEDITAQPLPAPRGIMRALREHTAALHRSAEAAVALDRIEDRASYAALLARMYGFYAPFAAAIAQVPALPAVLEWNRRGNLALLAADLAHLGVSPQALDHLQLAVPRSHAEAVGGLYVVEGATLGGRVICRMLAARAALADVPRAFFAGYGADTGPRWRAFGDAAEALVVTPAEREQAQAYAAYLFAAFRDWMAR